MADLDGESFLETASVGLLPFIPLMKPPESMDMEEWLKKCVEKIEAAPVDTQTRGTLFLALSTLGSLVYDLTLLQKFISEEMMQESPFIEHLIQKYSEQGSRETYIKNTISVLTERFPQSDLQSVAQALDSILDLEYLTELHRKAVNTTSVKAFLQALNGSEV